MVEEVERANNGLAAISKLKVQLNQSDTATYLSSQIYSFMAARRPSKSPRAPSRPDLFPTPALLLHVRSTPLE